MGVVKTMDVASTVNIGKLYSRSYVTEWNGLGGRLLADVIHCLENRLVLVLMTWA